MYCSFKARWKRVKFLNRVFFGAFAPLRETLCRHKLSNAPEHFPAKAQRPQRNLVGLRLKPRLEVCRNSSPQRITEFAQRKSFSQQAPRERGILQPCTHRFKLLERIRRGPGRRWIYRPLQPCYIIATIVLCSRCS